MAYDYTPEQIKTILDALAVPFDPKDVKWRVTKTSKDGKSGCVAPYADPRAYTTRLNDVLTPAGWSCELKVGTTTGLTRMVRGKSVPTGKVSVIATLEIFGISKKSSTGEKWADDDNALTGSEAQAMKRAAALFGLGKYFYDFKNIEKKLWMPLDERGNPTELPELPPWALPAGAKQAENRQQSTQQKPQAASAQRQNQAPAHAQRQNQTTPSSWQAAEKQFHDSRKGNEHVLGQALVTNILEQIAEKLDSGEIDGDRFAIANKKLEEAKALLDKVRAAAAEIHHSTLDGILAQYQVKDLNTITTYQVLYRIAVRLKVVPSPSERLAA